MWDHIVGQYKAAGRPKTDALWTTNYLQLAEAHGGAAMMVVRDAAETLAGFSALGVGRAEDPPSIGIVETSRDPAAKDREVFSLSSAADLYASKLAADVSTGERSASDANRQKTAVGCLLRFIADEPFDPSKDEKLTRLSETGREAYLKELFRRPSPVAFRAIEAITYDHAFAAVSNFKHRAVSLQAANTIANTMTYWRQFFDWLADSRKWVATFNYSRLFRADRAKLRTILEAKKLNTGQDTFTLVELATLYANASRWQRALILRACPKITCSTFLDS